MVGFEDETEMLIKQLVAGPRQLDVISIFGMPGLGKTTLAKKLYTDHVIFDRFDNRMWCCSSQVYDRKSLLLELLGHIMSKLDDETNEMNGDELADKLFKKLKGKRYLVVVDDVWSTEAWDDIKSPFPDDNNGSRIILTTRLESVATYAEIHSTSHHLRLFSEEESWMLMVEKLFKEDSCPQELEETGKRIAKKCGGLPLAIVLIAGILANHDKEVIFWQEVEESLKSEMKGCTEIIESSYKHLPIHLKSCFLYFASFLEDQEVSVQKLIALWIAEGFVEASTGENLEVLAMTYLMDLISSNLVMVSKINFLGELKGVHVHDLVHEFSLVRADAENFSLRIYKSVEKLHNFETRCRRVNILGSYKDAVKRLPGELYSLRFLDRNWPVSSLTYSWRQLRVLELRTWGDISALQFLIHLKYLEIDLFSHSFADFISNLKKLETLVVTGEYTRDIINPNAIWGLVSLRHLHVKHLYILEEVLEDLPYLHTCLNLIICDGIDHQKFMKRLPNLHKLKCKLKRTGNHLDRFFPAFNYLTQLRSLKIGIKGWSVFDLKIRDGFIYPSTLRKLSLRGLGHPWSNISTIGCLPNLEVLKLDIHSFRGEQWDVKDDEFPNLKVLKLGYQIFTQWTASDKSFPSLQKVQMQNCFSLEELPCSFGSKCSMQVIELISCSVCIVNSAMKIKEMQTEEMGNYKFNVIIIEDDS